MKNILNLIMFSGVACFSACTFSGLATKPSETYNTTYNLPGEKISPYNDPSSAGKFEGKEINVCEGKADSKGFKCIE